MKRRLSVLAVLFVLFVLPAQAHEGEDHSQDAAAPAPAPQAQGLASVWDASETFELLARHDKLLPGDPATLTFYLSEWRTNRPVNNATMDLEITGPTSLTAKAVRTRSPGEYTAEITWPEEGEYAATVTLESGSAVDLLSLSSFKVGERYYPDAPAADGAPTGRAVRWPLVLGIAAALLAAGAALLILRRRRTATVATLLAFALLADGNRPLPAHGGEDHGETPAATEARNLGDALTVAKPVQFLLGIETDLAERRPLSQTVEVVGRVKAAPDGDASVVAPLDGILSFPSGTPIRPGTRVRAGDTLAFVAPTLDPSAQSDLLVQRREAEAEARKARTALRVAKADWERARQLRRVLSERERQEIEAAYEAAQADLAAAEQIQGAFSTRERSGDRIAVRSPISGVVAEVLATAGTSVPQGERLFRVIDLGRLWVEGAAYENQLAALARAGDGQVEVPALRRRLPARLISRGFAVSPATRTAPIYFEVDDPSGLLLPEMSVKVYVPSGEPEVTLTVPKAALVETEGRKVLFVHPTPEEFRAREVETGWEDAGQVEIVRGVQEGERVVVKAPYELRSAAGVR